MNWTKKLSMSWGEGQAIEGSSRYLKVRVSEGDTTVEINLPQFMAEELAREIESCGSASFAFAE